MEHEQEEHMNIYRLIDSRDMRKHLQKLMLRQAFQELRLFRERDGRTGDDVDVVFPDGSADRHTAPASRTADAELLHVQSLHYLL